MPSAVLLRPPKYFDKMNELATADWLHGELTEPRGGSGCAPPLILDCRLQASYAAGHIRGAINVALPGILLRRLATDKVSIDTLIKCSESREKFLKNWKTHTVVLCGDEADPLFAANADSSSSSSLLFSSSPSSSPFSNVSTLHTLYRNLEQNGCHVVYLQGGFSEFYEKYPEWCSSAERCLDPEGPIIGLQNLRISSSLGPCPMSTTGGHCSDTDSSCSEDFCDSSLDLGDGGTPPFHDPCPFPVEILPNLYLGNARNSTDLEALERHQIRYILNVTSDLPNRFKNNEDITYLQIPIDDHWSQNLASFFPQAFAFIDEARQKHLGVLVHCLAGISRSVTITVAYLMQKCGMTLNDAYDFVKKRKANISPNFSFMDQLRDFERQLNLSPASHITAPLPCPCPPEGPCTCCRSGTTPDSGIDIGNWV